jgi:hypothetical protein
MGFDGFSSLVRFPLSNKRLLGIILDLPGLCRYVEVQSSAVRGATISFYFYHY